MYDNGVCDVNNLMMHVLSFVITNLPILVPRLFGTFVLRPMDVCVEVDVPAIFFLLMLICIFRVDFFFLR